MRGRLQRLAVAFAASLLAACGSPPGPAPDPGSGRPPANELPVIGTMTAQGTRPSEPASFADLGETIAVSAEVSDRETPPDQLEYVWTASAGTVSGTGATVAWQAPPAPLTTPADVTLTLKVVEKFGNPGGPLAFEHAATKSASLSLHDSIAEVGTMARQFLLDFSDTNIKDVDYIMRNFGTAATCPQPGEIASERSDVIDNYTKRRIVSFRVDAPRVTVNFKSTCPFRGKRGDACALVNVFWDSIEDGVRGSNTGDDVIAAAYSPNDRRWFLCASDYNGRPLFAGAASAR